MPCYRGYIIYQGPTLSTLPLAPPALTCPRQLDYPSGALEDSPKNALCHTNVTCLFSCTQNARIVLAAPTFSGICLIIVQQWRNLFWQISRHYCNYIKDWKTFNTLSTYLKYWNGSCQIWKVFLLCTFEHTRS